MQITAMEHVDIDLPIKNRTVAGQALGKSLAAYTNREDVIVLALPRGGVPVGYEVARAINAPLDLMLVRKLGIPGQEELAMGAIATGGARVLNDDIIAAMCISENTLSMVAKREQLELERRQRAYRGNRPLPHIEGQCVILVDDGVATGATMLAAVTALRQLHPGRIVVAIPVAPLESIERLQRETDEVVCLETPDPFLAIGRWYQAFPQLSDNDVRRLLARIWSHDRGEVTHAHAGP
jgi:putative phosphoribosyl transferase